MKKNHEDEWPRELTGYANKKVPDACILLDRLLPTQDKHPNER